MDKADEPIGSALTLNEVCRSSEVACKPSIKNSRWDLEDLSPMIPTRLVLRVTSPGP